jgi:polar amino acid transport system permease protein
MDVIVEKFFNFAILTPYWPVIFQGTLITISMSVMTLLIGIPLGFVIAFLRTYEIRLLNFLIIVYVDIFRSIPGLVLVFIVYFSLPYFGLSISSYWTTVLSLAVVLSAFAEEILWASITSVPRGQWEAGRSTGLSFTSTLVNIILPQSIRMSIPPLTNRAIAISKMTTLGSVVAVSDLLGTVASIQSNIANPTALTAGALIFVIMFVPLVKLSRALEGKFSGNVAR